MHKPFSIVLLMTATVDPKGCPDARFAVAERKRQYLSAFAFYVRKLAKGGGYDAILFCENSGADLSDFRALVPPALRERVEFLSAPPELFPAWLKKSNEFGLIDYACDHARLLRAKGSAFFKVTGRYSTLNIGALVREVRACGDTLDFFCDQKDHRFYERLGLDWCQQNGEMRYIFFSVAFWRRHLYGYFARNPSYRAVESVVFDVARAHYGAPNCRFRFRHEARFRGYQGQQAAFLGMRFSPRVDYLTSDLRWILSATLRFLFPKWWF